MLGYKKQVNLLRRKQFHSRLCSISAKMMLKTFVLIGCAIVVQAGLLPEKAEENYESRPSYSFSYDVQDINTGDFKSQSETRDGDNVQGRYLLNDPDGYRRIVEYSSDAVNGFQANVRREPLDGSPIVASAPAAVLKQAAPEKPAQPQQNTVPVQLKSYVQPAAVVRTFAAPTLVHPVHAAPAFIHSSPAVHLAPALVKSAPGQLIAHHQPAAVVKTSFATPHVSFVY